MSGQTTLPLDQAVVEALTRDLLLVVVEHYRRAPRETETMTGPAEQLHSAARVISSADINSKLTPREVEVLEAIVGPSCLSNKEAAARFGISRRTIEVYRLRIMKKTGAKNAAELTRMAVGAPILRAAGWLP